MAGARKPRWQSPPPTDMDEKTEDEILELAGRILYHRAIRRITEVRVPYVGKLRIRAYGRGLDFTRPQHERRVALKAQFDVDAAFRRNALNRLPETVACPHGFSVLAMALQRVGGDRSKVHGYERTILEGRARDIVYPCYHPQGDGHPGPCIDYKSEPYPIPPNPAVAAAEIQRCLDMAAAVRAEQQRLQVIRDTRFREDSAPLTLRTVEFDGLGFAVERVSVPATEAVPAKKEKVKKVKEHVAPEDSKEAMKRTMKRLEVD